MAETKKLKFQNRQFSNFFGPLIDANGIDVAQPIWS